MKNNTIKYIITVYAEGQNNEHSRNYFSYSFLNIGVLDIFTTKMPEMNVKSIND